MNEDLSSEPILQSGATSPTDTVLPKGYPTTDQLSLSRATAIEVVRAYLQAWNDHDGVAVTRQFAPNGTYVDPTLPGPLSGEGIAMHVAGLVAAFPNLAFTVESMSVDADRVTLQWRMRGTNTGPPPGATKPTRGTCDLPGVDLINIGSEGIISVVGYFDQKTFIEQLGLQARIVPRDEWPLHFGTSARTDLENTTVPGALTMTWIDVDNDQEEAEVQLRGTNIVEALSSEPGFIGWVGTFSYRRGHTMTAWTSPEAAEAAISRNIPHSEARGQVLDSKLGRHVFTSFWKPHHMNNQVSMCSGCGHMVSIATGVELATCKCGGQVKTRSYI